MTKGVAKVYCDGSFDRKLTMEAAGIGVIILYETEDDYPRAIVISGSISEPNFAKMWNVGGEIKAATLGIFNAISIEGISRVEVYHDYEGIAKWVTGDWEAKNAVTEAYRGEVRKYFEESEAEIVFYKVRSHTGNKYNEYADKLAKKGLLDYTRNVMKFLDNDDEYVNIKHVEFPALTEEILDNNLDDILRS